MAKIKGLKKINKIINEFTIKNFGVTAEIGTDFQAYCNSKHITYALVMTSESINYFKADAETRFPQVKADIFLWCLMHEIGHCMTDETWTIEEQAYFDCQKETLTGVEDDFSRYSWYHAIPDEYFATKYAGNFMTKHPKKMAKFWAKLGPALMIFYEKNGLMEN